MKQSKQNSTDKSEVVVEEKEKHPGGRPTKYNAKIHIDWARGLSMQGFTMDEIADRMLIARSTVYEWMEQYDEFSDAIKTGKEMPDLAAESTLMKKVIGFDYTETKSILNVDAKGTPQPARIESTTKKFIPDTTALIFWLTNRRPDRWRHKMDFEVDIKNNDLEKMTKDELSAKIKELEEVRNAGRKQE